MIIDNEYFNTNEFKSILKVYEEKLNSGENFFFDIDDLIDVADYYTYNDEVEKSNVAMEMAYKLYPDSSMPLLFKAQQALDNGDKEAVKHYLRRITDKDNAQYKNFYAEFLIAQDKVNEANRFLLQCLDECESKEERNSFVIDCGNLFADYHENKLLSDWLKLYTGDMTEDAMELYARESFLNQDYEKSEKLFAKLTEDHPYTKQYWSTLASSQYLQDHFSDCIASIEYALAIDPNYKEGLHTKATTLQRIGRSEEAMTYYSAYCALCPLDSFVMLEMAMCQNDLNQPQEAIKTLKTAYEYGSPNKQLGAQILEEIAFVNLAIEEYDQALTYVQKAVELDCDNVNAYLIKGHILTKAKRKAEAQEAFDHAMLYSNDRRFTLLRIIVFILEQGNFPLCYKLLHRFIQDEDDKKNNNRAGAYIAVCCFEMNKRTECLNYLHEAIELVPKEVKSAFIKIAPPELPLEKYYEFIENELNKKSQEQ